jgi:hypothetical protein
MLRERAASDGRLLRFDVGMIGCLVRENDNLSRAIDLEAVHVKPRILGGPDSFGDVSLSEHLETARHF